MSDNDHRWTSPAHDVRLREITRAAFYCWAWVFCLQLLTKLVESVAAGIQIIAFDSVLYAWWQWARLGLLILLVFPLMAKGLLRRDFKGLRVSIEHSERGPIWLDEVPAGVKLGWFLGAATLVAMLLLELIVPTLVPLLPWHPQSLLQRLINWYLAFCLVFKALVGRRLLGYKLSFVSGPEHA